MNKLLIILFWLASLSLSEAQPAGYRFKTNVVVVMEPIPVMRWYYAVRPSGVFELMGQFETDGPAINTLSNTAANAILWFPSPLPPGTVVWQPHNVRSGIAAPMNRSRTVQRSVEMPPLPGLLALPTPAVGIVHRYQHGQLDGVQAWMTNSATNAWIFQVSTNLLDWNQAGNEQVWPDWPGVRMTETGIQGQTFIRAHKL